MKKCKKDLDWHDEKLDEYARCKANTMEVTKNKLDCCEMRKKTKKFLLCWEMTLEQVKTKHQVNVECAMMASQRTS